jgi:Protein of unknown function (DUF1416)
MSNEGCGAPAGGVPMPQDVGGQAIVEGRVTRSGVGLPVGYARLLDEGGDFVAEVPLGQDGGFRFFAAPGTWTLRVLAPGGVNAEQTVTAAYNHVTAVQVTV